MQQLPQKSESYWLKTLALPNFPKLEKNEDVDIAVVGGGITGVTASFLLAKEGFRVALLETNSLLKGTTGHTTAKVTAQHGLIYDELIQNIGLEKAQLYYEANQRALDFIKSLVNEFHIDCDFSIEDAYIYAEDEKSLPILEKEYEAYDKIGIKGKLVSETPLPFKVKSALVMDRQFQFHPLKYLQKLVEELQRLGVKIYENTTALEVELNGRPKVLTKEGFSVTSDFVLSCSHFPFHDKGFYFARMYPERSYVVASLVENPVIKGMYISAEDPVRSLRFTPYNGEHLLLIGGDHHKTGQGVSTEQHYENLKQFTEHTFKVKSFPFRWSAQDFTTLDKLPYIGHITSKENRLLVATGYRKWGMTSGTLAGLLFKDLIMGQENPYRDIFTPSRFESFQTVKQFFQTNLDVAKHFIQGKMEKPSKTIEDLKPEEGAIVDVDGEKRGAYRDANGKVYMVEPTCTHLGCEVEWNAAERTWDCPCHGSRFHYKGDVLEGPAEKPLKRISET